VGRDRLCKRFDSSARIENSSGHQERPAYGLSAAGVSDLFVAQMIGHSSPGILQRYAKAIDEYRRDAVRKLEEMRAEHAPLRHAPPVSIN
jgi:hypothetical protein